MKNTKRFLSLNIVLLLLSSLLAVPASANSAQSQWEGTNATGAIVTGEDCPIIVEHELLTFDIGQFPEQHYLYMYAPAPSDAVYVYREGETYMAAIFCNFEMFDSSNTSHELTELYRVYNIEAAEDIASISEVDWHRDKVIGATVTDQKEISDFYDMTAALWSYGNDDFQKLMFSGYQDEETQRKAHIAFADDSRVLRIETASGLRLYISLYPGFNWMSSSGTMSYYQINEQMHAWIDRNLD